MYNKFKNGSLILRNIDFTKLNDCSVEEIDGIFYLIVKHSAGEACYTLGLKTKKEGK